MIPLIRHTPSVATVLILAAIALVLSGCAAQGEQYLGEASQAYKLRDYATAQRKAEKAIQFGMGTTVDEAAYLAGRSAQELGQTEKALQHFNRATRSTNPSVAGDALASAGLILSRQERFDQAVTTFLKAAEKLRGQDRAEAYFHAAATQQKLGLWDRARANLALARASSTDRAFLNSVAQQLRTQGFTLQVGAFSEPANAQRAAAAFLRDKQVVQIGGPRLVDATDPAGRRLTLVQIGRFSTYSAASAARRQANLDKAIVVPVLTSF